MLSWGGTPVGHCSCGRIHYQADGQFMDEGELERMEKNRKEAPKRYFPRNDGDSVGVGVLGGVAYVWGCECGRLEQIEQFLWGNRDAILTFYRARLAREKAQAAAAEETLKGL